MTITSMQRPASLQAYSQTNNSNYTQSYEANSQCTQSDIEDYIYNLIQQGKLFQAKTHMELINATNGYIVISNHQFKVWRIEHLRNEKSKIKTDKGLLENQMSNSLKGLIDKPFFINQNGNMLKEYAKAYMKLISN